jgi:hypothetical protein
MGARKGAGVSLPRTNPAIQLEFLVRRSADVPAHEMVCGPGGYEQSTLSNSPYQEGRRHQQAEHNYRKKSGSHSLFFMRRQFSDFARGFNDLRIFAGGVVLADRRVPLITVAIYSPASAERLMRHHSK